VAYAPLQKVKDQPFSQKGALLNRVYIARQHDSWKSVSEKIYGMNNSPKLKSWNPGIAGRGLKVGDKVYYNSPKDSSDGARMLNYYEEAGIPPQSYVSKDGDNLRQVGSQLLGDKNSWKELWVTNRDLASKGALPAGIDIKYWPDGAAPGAPAQALAGNNPPPSAPSDGLVPPPAADNMMDPTGTVPPGGAPPGSPQVAQNQPPPAAAPIEPPAPPPPPPPPPPVPVKKPIKAEAAEPAAADADTMMMLGAVGIVLIGSVLAYVVIRKKQSKRIDLSQTQV
jgi:hypothetical protein